MEGKGRLSFAFPESQGYFSRNFSFDIQIGIDYNIFLSYGEVFHGNPYG
jgi:hypothetical protein